MRIIDFDDSGPFPEECIIVITERSGRISRQPEVLLKREGRPGERIGAFVAIYLR
jgi:hypothetical protein